MGNLQSHRNDWMLRVGICPSSYDTCVPFQSTWPWLEAMSTWPWLEAMVSESRFLQCSWSRGHNKNGWFSITQAVNRDWAPSSSFSPSSAIAVLDILVSKAAYIILYISMPTPTSNTWHVCIHTIYEIYNTYTYIIYMCVFVPLCPLPKQSEIIASDFICII